MADERRIFPTETVLELVLGKNGPKVEELATFLTGRPIENGPQTKAIAPFAIAWLARWQPKLVEADLSDAADWNKIVSKMKAELGDNISVVPVSGGLKAVMDSTLNTIRDTHESMLTQAQSAADLERKVHELEQFETTAKAAQKKNDELEARLKAMKTDMGAMQRKLNEYDGKLAIDNDELMRSIRDAIKEGMKGLVIAGAATAGVPAGAGEAETAGAAEPASDEDEFGFGASKSSDDEFGF